ncbi:hypothetical protein [Bacillus cereus]|uniref:hypothetical protein n=1 Tax=Bacillus cereus TaxID=1396 RepID=UPI001E475DD2|nr:hypothetical protein [Bacillus cereus]
MGKPFNPTSIRVDETVYDDFCTSVSTNKDTKYLPLGFRLIVVFRIRSVTLLFFSIWTWIVEGVFYRKNDN